MAMPRWDAEKADESWQKRFVSGLIQSTIAEMRYYSRCPSVNVTKPRDIVLNYIDVDPQIVSDSTYHSSWRKIFMNQLQIFS
mgnify:CR=1 FL=1|jgi:hypothetical protein|tara:strand:+ start:276 stop:521 length:246 start_codon:yes stop_codon:yes gene_type:complete